MQDLYNNHKPTAEDAALCKPIIDKTSTARINSEEERRIAVGQMCGGDQRLSLFGYTVETITMLLLPMINTKLVYSFSMVIILLCVFVKVVQTLFNFPGKKL